MLLWATHWLICLTRLFWTIWALLCLFLKMLLNQLLYLQRLLSNLLWKFPYLFLVLPLILLDWTFGSTKLWLLSTNWQWILSLNYTWLVTMSLTFLLLFLRVTMIERFFQGLMHLFNFTIFDLLRIIITHHTFACCIESVLLKCRFSSGLYIFNLFTSSVSTSLSYLFNIYLMI